MISDFNKALKIIRKDKGITQEQLAETVGVSPQAVSKWEINGYPDASLLPVIAEYLGVSIDELFGNTVEKEHILDEIVRYIKEQPYEEMMQKAMEIGRAVSCGLQYSEKYHNISDKAFNNPDFEIYSEVTRNEGFVQSRLCESLQYFLIMPEPKKGYDNVLKYDESYAELFKFLGKPDALRAMYYFAGRNGWMFSNVGSLAKALGISSENAQEILDGMVRLNLLDSSSLSSERGEERIYKSSLGCNFVSFMTFCYILLNRPHAFNLQSGNRDGDKPYLKNDSQNIKDDKEK